jgi:uncharacterized membrane protein
MNELLAATGLFVLSHALPALSGPRAALIGRFGRGTYLAAYSLLSLATLAWLAVAFFRAPYIALWDQEEWMRWVPLCLMPFSCILLSGGLAVHNPLSLTLRGQGFEAHRPGFLALTRHPLPWALVLWTGAHIPPNGDAAGVLMFGLLLALSLYGTFALDRKRRAALGTEAWAALAARTSNLPLARPSAGGAGRSGPIQGAVGQWAAAIGGGMALYFAILLVHEYIIGVDPLP